MTWLVYAGCVLVLLVAACGVVPLRRHQDRRWAEYQRRLAAEYFRIGEQLGAAERALPWHRRLWLRIRAGLTR